MSTSTRDEVRVVKVTDSRAVKVANNVWVMRANYHLDDGRVIDWASGMHRLKRDAVKAGARMEAEVGNTKAIWHPGEDLDGKPTFIVSHYKSGVDPATGRFGMVVDWDAD